ncbi:peptide-methionine (S)-S-oxide reductase MsrA [soil metagenome]
MSDRSMPASLKSSFRLLLGAAGLGMVLLAAPMAGRALAALAGPTSVEEPRLLPASTAKSGMLKGNQTVVFAGGCFWGVQGVFQHVTGVVSAVSGYDGGSKANAIYEVVGTGRTGHAEAVEVTYDPTKVSYETLLRIFFSVATDPTQLNQQFPDAGTQYRGAIFYNTPEQKRIAEAYIAQLNAAKVFRAPIATKVVPNSGFYPAEGYHQNYLTLHPGEGYIATYDLPKVAALKKYFPAQYRQAPILVATR